MNEPDQTGLGWTVVLRRQPSRIVEGRAEGGHTDAYELVCRECGDHPDTDYREVSSKLQQIRGPYPIATGIAAYERHVLRYHGPRASPLGRAARLLRSPALMTRSPRSRRGWWTLNGRNWEMRYGNGY